jgi:hypothetical protein
VTSNGVIPTPKERQRGGRPPSLGDLVERLLDHDLPALADAWEAEAGDDLQGASGLARKVALNTCAQQLRKAIAREDGPCA